ncbi:MAG: helix-turn-helix domain-containing protein [Candidatus Moraniibacteriota bacterium]
MLLEKLQIAGLSEKEAKVYVAVLELGEATIAEITKKSKIKRSTIYDILNTLKEKGIISQTRLNKRPIFLAENPKKMLEKLEEKKRGLEEAVPELLSIMNLLDKKPKIRYFEGIEGVREVFEDTLRYPNQELLTWFSHPNINLGEDFFWKYYNPERLKRKIWGRAIATDTPQNRALNETFGNKWLAKMKISSNKSLLKLDIEIKIYGKNKVGIVSYKEDLGIVIESKKIYDGLKAIFEVMWDLLPEIK